MEVLSTRPTSLTLNIQDAERPSSFSTVRENSRCHFDSCKLALKCRCSSRTDSIASAGIHRHSFNNTNRVLGEFGRYSSGTSFSADRRFEEAAVDESPHGEQAGQELDSAVRGEVVPTQPSPSVPLISLLVNYSVLVSDWWLLKNTVGPRLFSGLQSLPVTQLASQVDMSTAKTFLQKFRRKLSWGSGSESGATVEPLAQGAGAELADQSKERAAQELDEGMTSVVDDLDSSVVWEQRPEDVEADRKRGPVTSPGFSFSAAGLLFPYHLGVCQCLLEHGYIRETTPLSGSSAGAIVCAVVASGVSMRVALEATKRLSEDCREKGTAFRLGAVLRKFLEDFLPEDAHIRASGRIRVAVTCVFRSPRGLLVEAFDSKEDLINALITSSFIPGYLAPAPMTWFRDRYCIDGGISLFMPPTATEETVRVCAFPFTALGLESSGISPDLNPEGRASMRELFSWALEPGSDEVLEKLFAEGYQDTRVWIKNDAGKKRRLEQGQLGEAGELAVAGGRS